MNRLDHHCSPIAPRLLLALIPPSTRRGRDGGQSAQFPLMLCLPLASGAPPASPSPFIAPPSLVARSSLLSPGAAPLWLDHYSLTASRQTVRTAPRASTDSSVSQP